ncbi:DUF4255 domain-containing protein [Gimesia algae]|uniref:Pvc16 N-terminal domain-containing protein n=1 Tax=Gimesia algae TaxID=2527971 RepID=A0A517VBS7_9PLAN|nr:DUF4255 domain-containing protein [Gimesia algae]QDT90451.1 hypothetical protein Pan161_21030 [Gimesia algae]
MSTSSAIRAVTEKLAHLLSQVLSNGIISTKTPDNIDGENQNPLNIFLYHIAVNGTWRNQDLPVSGQRGQPRRPLLALNLYYLVSVAEEKQLDAYDILGRAMLFLHEQPVLTGFDYASGIRNQRDPIRVTLQPLNLDELTKLWSGFQTPYRTSVAYEVGTVLIESVTPDPAPLPVLSRGEDGTGWNTAIRFPPLLTGARFQNRNQYGARIGETVTLIGENLGVYQKMKVIFQHQQLNKQDIVDIDAETKNDREIVIKISELPEKWRAGVYLVHVQDGPEIIVPAMSTNQIPIALLPEITGTELTVRDVDQNHLRLEIPCRPPVKDGQRVQIIIGSVELKNVIFDQDKLVAEWNQKQIKIPPADKPDELPYARLRIDGAESLIYDPTKLENGFNTTLLVKGLP